MERKGGRFDGIDGMVRMRGRGKRFGGMGGFRDAGDGRSWTGVRGGLAGKGGPAQRMRTEGRDACAVEGLCGRGAGQGTANFESGSKLPHSKGLCLGSYGGGKGLIAEGTAPSSGQGKRRAKKAVTMKTQRQGTAQTR